MRRFRGPILLFLLLLLWARLSVAHARDVVADALRDTPDWLLGAGASLVGIGILIMWESPLTPRRLALVVASGLACALMFPPFAAAAAHAYVDAKFLPGDEYIYAASGFVFGLLGVRAVAALLAFGDGMRAGAKRRGDRIAGG